VKKKTPKKVPGSSAAGGVPENRRGSAEAIEKRRAARRFNDVLMGGARPARDGRTEKRRQRLLKELADGTARGGKAPLKPIDVLLRVQTLLELGERVSALRKVRRPPKAIPSTAELLDGVRRLHRAYDFDPEVYQFVGLDLSTLRQAGVLTEGVLKDAGKVGQGRAPEGPGLVASRARAPKVKRATKRRAA